MSLPLLFGLLALLAFLAAIALRWRRREQARDRELAALTARLEALTARVEAGEQCELEAARRRTGGEADPRPVDGSLH